MTSAISLETQTLGFQTEVTQLLQLMIHSLYSNKEIFLRELISNASDATDKLRFLALSNDEYYEKDSELKVELEINKIQRTLTIRDNGIGMTRDEVISHLGTIAKSGTKDFFASLTGDQAKDMQLIGQFGVGFYSAFIVADQVTVKTRKAGSAINEGVEWTSRGEGEYTIAPLEKLTRGTEIILHLRASEDEFLEPYRLRGIIQKYSDHITLPIKMKKESTTDESETPLIWEIINQATALWTLPKNNISNENYEEFYKHLAHDFEAPLAWAHNRVEGKQEYISLLYIPKRAPFDLWNTDKTRGLKLYVKRVFIMDEAEQFLPRYLRFVKGVLDSADLPLNISREILQNNKMVENLRVSLTKRVLDILTNLAEESPDKYQEFWKEFGNVIKEGPAEDILNREVIAKLMRFSSTHTNNPIPTVSLEDYIKRMDPQQSKIYYMTADSFANAEHSPHLEIFRKNNIEVLLMYDRVDEWLISHLHEFSGKTFQSVAKGALDLPQEATQNEKEIGKTQEAELKDVIKELTTILGERVKEVRLSKRLTTSPACVVNDENALSNHMQRLLKAAGQAVPPHKPILEINPEHELILKLSEENDMEQFAEWGILLFEQAILAEGGQLEDPAGFVRRLNQLLMKDSRK